MVKEDIEALVMVKEYIEVLFTSARGSNVVGRRKKSVA